MTRHRPTPISASPTPGDAHQLATVVATLRDECRHLERHVEIVQRENALLTERLGAAEQLSGDSLRLLVADRRLAECQSRASVLEAAEEIIISVVGCEDYALFGLDDEQWTFWPLVARGERGAQCGPVRRDDPIFGLMLTTRESKAPHSDPTADSEPSSDNVVACIPLLIGDRLLGVLALFRLLPHRGPLSAADVEVLEFLAGSMTTRLVLTKLAERDVAALSIL